MAKQNLVAAYVRVSTDEQAEQGLSIPAQKSRLLAYCQSQGWEIYDFYVDDGYSGKDLDRPAMQKLIEDAGAGAFNIALVLKLDRLSRRQKDVLYLLEDVFEPAGVGFKSATESFDTTTPFGKAALGMMAVFAQLERETILERARMGKLEAARKGRWHGGTILYGYSYEPGTYILKIRESEARVVREIYNMYLNSGLGIYSIANELNNRGVPGPDGGIWIKQTVSYVLNNPTYAGYSKHKGNLYEGMHEAIITKEQWKSAQALLEHRREKHYRRPSQKALLAGIIYCAECGARMRNKTVWQNYPREPKNIMRYYVCYSQDGTANHMVRDQNCRCGYKRMEDIDGKVIERLLELSIDDKLIKAVISEELSSDNTDQKNAMRGLNQTQKELQQVNKALNRWYEAFEKGALDPDELTERVKDLRAKREHLERSIVEWEAKLKEEKQRATNVKELLETMKNFKLIWESAKPDEKRDILINLIQEVRVNKESGVEVKFNL